MKIAEAVRERKSCRTFNGLRLDKSTIAEIRSAIGELTPLWDEVSRPVIALIDRDDAPARMGTYGVINGARQFLVMAMGDGDAEKVQAGFMMEQLILRLTAMGLATCWLGGTFRRGPFEQGLASQSGGVLPEGYRVQIVVPVGHATPKRRLADRMMRSMVKADRRLPFDKLFQHFAPGSAISRVMESVRLVPSSTNSQPWRATFEAPATVRFSHAKTSAYTSVDMGIAYSHFVLAAEEENIRVKPSSPVEANSLSFTILKD